MASEMDVAMRIRLSMRQNYFSTDFLWTALHTSRRRDDDDLDQVRAELSCALVVSNLGLLSGRATH